MRKLTKGLLVAGFMALVVSAAAFAPTSVQPQGETMIVTSAEAPTVTIGETMTEVVFANLDLTISMPTVETKALCPTTCTFCCGCVEKGFDPIHWRVSSPPTMCMWQDVWDRWFIQFLE